LNAAGDRRLRAGFKRKSRAREALSNGVKPKPAGGETCRLGKGEGAE
jgi:hypothetical protein